MVRYVLMALVGLLVCGLSDAQADCSKGNYFNVLGTAFDALNNSVRAKYADKLYADVEGINRIINSLTQCLSDIKAAENDCIQCMSTACQTRVNALGCTDVVSSNPSNGGCSLNKAICNIQNTGSKAVAAVIKTANTIAQVGKSVFKKIKKVVKVGVSTIGKTAKEIANVAKQTVSGIVKNAKKVGKTLENIVVNVGKKIVDGAKKAGKAIGKAAKKVGKFFRGAFRGRRRRQATEPTCTNFKTNATACNYYASQCSACSSFNIGGVEPTATDLANGVCGAPLNVNSEYLEKLILRLDQIADAAKNFAVLSVSYNPSSFNEMGKVECVKVTFSTKIREITLFSTMPVNILATDDTALQLVDDIYKEILPPVE